MSRLLCGYESPLPLRRPGIRVVSFRYNARGAAMRLIQWRQNGAPGARIVGEDGTTRRLRGVQSVYELALRAEMEKTPLILLAQELAGEIADYSGMLAAGDILPPLTHPDPARMLISGTGLTHWGSAGARDKMHSAEQKDETDSMRMFRLGVEGGKPSPGAVGAQPEWFYKGDGGTVVAPGGVLECPPFAENGGEEPEIAGLYIIGEDGSPLRAGFALGNEFSDHVMEKQNYLYLAHSKLRPCSFGPELLPGVLPSHVEGESWIVRGGETVWQKPFACGEDNMCHSIANLEHHHFKYAQFCRPGDVHIHFFGTATLSFADGFGVEDGDEFVISASVFGRPLANVVRFGRGAGAFAATRAL